MTVKRPFTEAERELWARHLARSAELYAVAVGVAQTIRALAVSEALYRPILARGSAAGMPCVFVVPEPDEGKPTGLSRCLAGIAGLELRVERPGMRAPPRQVLLLGDGTAAGIGSFLAARSEDRALIRQEADALITEVDRACFDRCVDELRASSRLVGEVERERWRARTETLEDGLPPASADLFA